jgi:hypothetical protein
MTIVIVIYILNYLKNNYCKIYLMLLKYIFKININLLKDQVSHYCSKSITMAWRIPSHKKNYNDQIRALNLCK